MSVRKKWVFGMSKNVEKFGGALENDERTYGQSWRPRIEITTAWDICKCVMVIPN